MNVNPLKDAPVLQMSPTCTLQRLCYDESGGTYTVNRLTEKKGGGAPLHSHPHRQIDYILSGQGVFQVGDEQILLKEGDVVTVEPNVPHAFRRVDEDMTFLEIFTPTRKDYIP